MDTMTLLYSKKISGSGSNPFICFRWAKCAGEVYGRGPLINALSAIKTCNLTIELILENAQMAISGVYQIDDDGVLNPDTIQLVPGSIIPKAMGSAGLQPIQAAGNFDVAQLVLGDMRLNIKRALYNDMLGDPNKTPATATEVAERMADLSRRMGSAFGRLQTEVLIPIIKRVAFILTRRGIIAPLQLDGREIAIKFTSPLANAQDGEDILNVQQAVQFVLQNAGPDQAKIGFKLEDFGTWVAAKTGMPSELVRTEAEKKQIIQAGAEAAQAGMPPAQPPMQ